ncbi:lipopolysaccharide heptosyltransferase II [Candidatus Fermentibacteria bacterium]|nr:lipopolysaccharide heptosyltransferase II [Candidatus Fermentibacteria bacterium]
MKPPVVILAPNWLGDIIMALPAMVAVRDGLASPCIVVARPSVQAIAGRVADHVILASRSLIGTLRLIRELRSARPFAVVSFLRSRRAGIIAFGSSAPTRVGWNSGPARALYSIRAPSARKRIHQSVEYLSLPAAMGLAAPAEWPSADGLGDAAADAPCIVMAPSAAFGPAKRWPDERYAALARELHAITGFPIVLTGTAAESAAIDVIARAAGPRVENQAGRTTLSDLASLLRRARVFVGNDSGAAHLAAWIGTPVVVVFGSTKPLWTRPMGPRVHVVYRQEPCSPCFARSCPLGHTNCLTRIDVDHVLKQCLRMMRGVTPESNPGECTP